MKNLEGVTHALVGYSLFLLCKQLFHFLLSIMLIIANAGEFDENSLTIKC